MKSRVKNSYHLVNHHVFQGVELVVQSGYWPGLGISARQRRADLRDTGPRPCPTAIAKGEMMGLS